MLYGAVREDEGCGKEILTQTTTWKNLENIMLSDVCQALKDKNCDSTSTKYLVKVT